MPNYDYECEKCGETFEVFQLMTDEKLKKCPGESCTGSVKRLIGLGAGVVFKGSGFYRSDSYMMDKAADMSARSSRSAAGKPK
tara:strand:- start:610 stop:858 length:249 start_codon:yes stop_codon:yes gene_type:complete